MRPDVSAHEPGRLRLLHLYTRMLQSVAGWHGVSTETQLFDELCAVAADLDGIALAWVGTWDDRSGSVEIVAARGRTAYLDGLRVTLDPADEGSRGPTGTAAREGRVVICDDIERSPAMRPWRDRALEHGLRSSACIPLLGDDGPFATLALYASRAGFFTPEEVLLAEELAASGAFIRQVRHTEADRYRLALTGSGVTAFTMDRDLRYTWMENAPLTGWGDVVGRTDADLFTPEAAERMNALKRRVIDHGQPFLEEVELGDRWFSVGAHPICDGSGWIAGLAGQATDVTARKRAELERERAISELQDAQRVANIGSWSWDPDTHGLRWSPQMYAIYGLDPAREVVDARGLLEYLHPDDRQRVAAEVRAMVTGGPLLDSEHRLIGADGQERVIRAIAGRDPRHPGGFMGTVQDLTEQRRVEHEHARAVEQLRELDALFTVGFDRSTIGMAVMDQAGNLLRLNESLADLLGVPSAALLGRNWTEFVHPEDLERRAAGLAEVLETGQQRVTQLRYVRGDGAVVHALVAATLVAAGGGREPVFLSQILDITDRVSVEDALQHLAHHDPLTGLYNRRRLLEELEHQLAFAARTGRGGAALVLDLDHLKFVNDTFGHRAGDALLQSVADVLRSRQRGNDLVARLGGDEFALVLAGIDKDEAMRVAAELRDELAALNAARRVAASIGVVPFTGSEQLTADDLIVCADTALYEAKERGGDQARLYAGEATGALRWVQRLREALDSDRFTLHAQPILELSTGRVAKHELLLRMLGEDGEVIPPGEFIPTAERFGLMHELDLWVVRHALELAGDDRAVTINVSGSSVESGAVVEHVRRAVRAGLDPALLTFEITETAAMTNYDAAKDFVAALSALGCSVALDDFGTGFCSFSYLKHITARFLKIDMEFVRELPDSPVDQEVVRAIVGIARSLGKQTIAEGVEHEVTIELLRASGVDFAQGYAIGRPQPLSDA